MAGLQYFYDLLLFQKKLQNSQDFYEGGNDRDEKSMRELYEVLHDLVHGAFTVMSNGLFIPAAQKMIAECRFTSAMDIPNPVGSPLYTQKLGPLYHAVFQDKPVTDNEVTLRINFLLQGICYVATRQLDGNENYHLLTSAIIKLNEKMFIVKRAGNYLVEPPKPITPNPIISEPQEEKILPPAEPKTEITPYIPVTDLLPLPQFPDVIPLIHHYEAAFAEFMKDIPDGGVGKNKEEIALSRAKDAKKETFWASFEDMSEKVSVIQSPPHQIGGILIIPENHPQNNALKNLGNIFFGVQSNICVIKSTKVTKEFAAVFATMMVTFLKGSASLGLQKRTVDNDKKYLRDAYCYFAGMAALDHLSKGSFLAKINDLIDNNNLQTEEDFEQFSKSQEYSDLLRRLDQQILPTAENEYEEKTRANVYRITCLLQIIERKKITPESKQQARIKLMKKNNVEYFNMNLNRQIRRMKIVPKV